MKTQSLKEIEMAIKYIYWSNIKTNLPVYNIPYDFKIAKIINSQSRSNQGK